MKTKINKNNLNFCILTCIIFMIMISSISFHTQALPLENNTELSKKHFTRVSFDMPDALLSSVFSPGGFGIFSPGGWEIIFHLNYKGMFNNLSIGNEDIKSGSYSITTIGYFGRWNGTEIDDDFYKDIKVNGIVLSVTWEKLED